MDEKMLLIAGFKSAKKGKGKDIEFLISIMNTHTQYIAFYVSVFFFSLLAKQIEILHFCKARLIAFRIGDRRHVLLLPRIVQIKELIEIAKRVSSKP